MTTNFSWKALIYSVQIVKACGSTIDMEVTGFYPLFWSKLAHWLTQSQLTYLITQPLIPSQTYPVTNLLTHSQTHTPYSLRNVTIFFYFVLNSFWPIFYYHIRELQMSLLYFFRDFIAVRRLSTCYLFV